MTYRDTCTAHLNICRCRLHPCFFTFIYIIPTDCKITNFSLCLFVNFFESIIFVAHTKKITAGTPQELIFGKPISQLVRLVFSFVLSVTQQCISKEHHEKHPYNPSSHCGKYGEYTRETCAPYLDT